MIPNDHSIASMSHYPRSTVTKKKLNINLTIKFYQSTKKFCILEMYIQENLKHKILTLDLSPQIIPKFYELKVHLLNLSKFQCMYLLTKNQYWLSVNYTDLFQFIKIPVFPCKYVGIIWLHKLMHTSIQANVNFQLKKAFQQVSITINWCFIKFGQISCVVWHPFFHPSCKKFVDKISFVWFLFGINSINMKFKWFI